MHRELVNLRPMLDDPGLRRILALAIGFPTPEKVERVCQRYRTEALREILGVLEDGAVVGCIGLEVPQEGEIRVLHIAVDRDRHGRGIGRWMLAQIRDRYPRRTLVAETDVEAVGFYRRCGFDTASLGSGQWGVERFVCRWEGQA